MTHKPRKQMIEIDTPKMQIFTEIVPEDYVGEYPYLVLKIKKSDIHRDKIISAISDVVINLEKQGV